MLILRCLEEEKVFFILKSDGTPHSIGRKDCSIILDEKSISRIHCTLFINPDLTHDSNQFTVSIQDHSKFGTFIRIGELERIQGSFQFTMPIEGIRIKFGPQSREYTIEQRIVKPCFSQGNGNGNGNTTLIGTSPFEAWTNECTHLVMNALSLTKKALLCLIAAKPIVTPQWLSSQAALPLGMEREFLPPLSLQEQTGFFNLKREMFFPNEKRKSLFNGMVFVFFCPEQLEKFGQIIENAGGRPIEMNTSELPNANEQEIQSNSNHLPNANEQEIQSNSNHLPNSNEQEIQSNSNLPPDSSILIATSTTLTQFSQWLNEEDEIGIAILECTTSRFKLYHKLPFSSPRQPPPPPPQISTKNEQLPLPNTKRFKKANFTPQQKIIPVGKASIDEPCSAKKPKILDEWLQSAECEMNSSPSPIKNLERLQVKLLLTPNKELALNQCKEMAVNQILPKQQELGLSSPKESAINLIETKENSINCTSPKFTSPFFQARFQNKL
jgi:hypothetical protein